MNQGRALTTTKEGITDAGAAYCGHKRVVPGTVLLSFKLSIGKVGISTVPLFTNEAIMALTVRRPEFLDSAYLYWALKFVDLAKAGDRAAMGKTLNSDAVARTAIPLPPPEEQRRIAEVLDRADALRAKRRAAPRSAN